jgi:hypothetical protein
LRVVTGEWSALTAFDLLAGAATEMAHFHRLRMVPFDGVYPEQQRRAQDRRSGMTNCSGNALVLAIVLVLGREW